MPESTLVEFYSHASFFDALTLPVCSGFVLILEGKKLQSWEVAYDGVQVMGAKYRLAAVLDVLEAYDSGRQIDLALEPEPENKHDQNAIRVVADLPFTRSHIGYLPAVLAETIAYRRLGRLKAEIVGADIDDQNRVKIEIRVLKPA